MDRPVARVLNLIAPESQAILNMTLEQAESVLLDEEASRLLEVRGSFALVARDQEKVILARSLDRPMRYFLAKETAGPMLIVAERIDQIHDQLVELGYGDQFHPTYTRMVPAHHKTTLRLVGCPDPNPVLRRFFDPPRETLPADLDDIGERYVGALLEVVQEWLQLGADRTIGSNTGVPSSRKEPIGVLFSGGIDSGAVLVALHHALLQSGQSPARLKAFTLVVGEGGADRAQARQFLRRTDLEFLGEEVEVRADALAPLRAVEVIEDYKPLDVECATVALALLEAIRDRYPQWRLLVDGDGGDENLKDYPIEENNELTIRSVVGNLMLYQEGWGVDSIKHSLTYSGGLSRGTVRTFAPVRRFGFEGFSPFTRPQVIAVAEAIPFDQLSQSDHQALYALKGEVVRRGMKRVLGVDFPVFEKRRFQHGVAAESTTESVFSLPPERYRQHYQGLHARP